MKKKKKIKSWQHSQTLPPSKNDECKSHYVHRAGLKMNCVAKWSRWQTLCSYTAGNNMPCSLRNYIMERVRKVVINVCWHLLLLWLISSLTKTLNARMVASSEAHALYYHLQCEARDVSRAPGHLWSHSLGHCLFWELWLPLTSP